MRRAMVRGLLGMTMVGALAFGSLGQPPIAQADTVAYEFMGSWENPPATVKSGSDALSAVWRFDINDDAPAPSNDPVDNNVVTFTAQNATFTGIPEVCLAKDVTPVSTLSADKKTLVCNIGTRNQGTAQVSFTGLVPKGKTGDLVTVTGAFLSKTVELPKIPIANPFVMDAKFDSGSVTKKALASNTAKEVLAFPWSLSHSTDSAAGPSSVQYDLTFTAGGGETLAISGTGCSPLDTHNYGYPYSASGNPAEKTANYPTCALTSLGANKFRLTLSNLNYTGPFPTQDTEGNPLPAGMDVIASGLFAVEFTYVGSTSISYTASTPSYATSGTPAQTSTDAAANNKNGTTVLRGVWTGGWDVFNTPYEGQYWADTYRATAGSTVRSFSGITGRYATNAICTVLDTKYVTFETAKLANYDSGVELTGVTYWYQTGTGTNNNLNPAHANYNPNAWTGCGSATTSANGWTSTKPTNLSTVKAVRVDYTAALAPQVGDGDYLFIDQKIKDTVAVGQDIWTWTSDKWGSTWYDEERSMNASDVPSWGVKTPNSRYPYAAVGRDVLRTIGSTPVVTKEVGQKEAGPGAVVDYRIGYGLKAPLSSAVPSQVVIVDKLPAGMAYVPGSATLAPVITGTVAAGQTLTWTIDNVVVNKNPMDVLTFQATVPETAAPATTFTNNVQSTSQGQTVKASASLVVPKVGYTTLLKTATTPVATAVNGVAEDGWTIRLTSVDPVTSAKTDTVDILPYIGDQRGTAFSGSYKLKQAVQAAAGATVYYTTAAPATLKEDPKDPSNGGFATITGNTVGWSTTYNANATAIRVIGPSLAYGKTQDFTVRIVTSGSKGGDTFVNTAVGRASDTQLRMRSSDPFTIERKPAFVLKKYVRDSAGDWHDAQTATDYPRYSVGDTARYRLVVENTGNSDLKNLPVTDTKVNLGQLFAEGKLTSDVTLEGNTDVGLKIKTLKVNEKATIEYDMVITEGAVEGTILVNTACVYPEKVSEGPAKSCDPAGVKMSSSLAWEKISAYSATTFLSGSEWNLIQVTGNGAAPVAGATAISVTDCVADQATACTGVDINPQAGRFKVKGLENSWYRLTETKAPAGYKLDPTPHYVQVSGAYELGEGIVNDLIDVPVLPLTGGVGSLGFWVVGGLGGFLAAAGLLWQRRKTQKI
ncbi:SpaA isopeptide-forming pilin-related protein [Paeniglutamicibacter sp. NPDC091659]|uniref:SpaA isopeptide-forming pilin-related protein n=1 Tax=Paeniglutamicibacter sp. NPDC091659 TaxID=3364389 RepID=UPI0037FE224A